jgi:hypothetical protein
LVSDPRIRLRWLDLSLILLHEGQILASNKADIADSYSGGRDCGKAAFFGKALKGTPKMSGDWRGLVRQSCLEAGVTELT